MVPSWCRFVRLVWSLLFLLLCSRDWMVHSNDEKLPHYILHSNSHLIYSMNAKNYWWFKIQRLLYTGSSFAGKKLPLPHLARISALWQGARHPPPLLEQPALPGASLSFSFRRTLVEMPRAKSMRHHQGIHTSSCRSESCPCATQQALPSTAVSVLAAKSQLKQKNRAVLFKPRHLLKGKHSPLGQMWAWETCRNDSN